MRGKEPLEVLEECSIHGGFVVAGILRRHVGQFKTRRHSDVLKDPFHGRPHPIVGQIGFQTQDQKLARVKGLQPGSQVESVQSPGQNTVRSRV